MRTLTIYSSASLKFQWKLFANEDFSGALRVKVQVVQAFRGWGRVFDANPLQSSGRLGSPFLAILGNGE